MPVYKDKYGRERAVGRRQAVDWWFIGMSMVAACAGGLLGALTGAWLL